MLSQKPSLSVYYVALTALLVVTFSSTSLSQREICIENFDSYSNIIPGYKALDALRAQSQYIDLSRGVSSFT